MDWNSKYKCRHCERSEAILLPSPCGEGQGERLQITSGCRPRNDVSTFFLPGFFLFFLILSSCSFKYGFEGGSVNYEITKTILISEFPDRTSSYSPLASMFNLALRKRFIEQTRLKEVNSNADIEIEGEISNFDVTNMAVKSDAYSSQTRLTITVRVQYFNNKEAGKNVEQSFSAPREYPSTSSLDEVQDKLVKEIIDELVDMIYNATIANW